VKGTEIQKLYVPVTIGERHPRMVAEFIQTIQLKPFNESQTQRWQEN
jgi:hypothetical protein